MKTHIYHMLRCGGGVQSESIKHPDSEDTHLLCRIGSWRMILSCVFGSREGMIVFFCLQCAALGFQIVPKLFEKVNVSMMTLFVEVVNKLISHVCAKCRKVSMVS